jgi:hypothetical protein
MKNRSWSKAISVDKLNDVGVVEVDNLRNVIERSIGVGEDITVDSAVKRCHSGGYND